MRLLRDVRETTRLLILLEVTTHRHNRMKPIAEKMGLTVQGVSDYLKAMQGEGLIHRVGGVYAATMKGVDHLQEQFKNLKEFVDAGYSQMQIMDIASALAGDEIEEGERVGLFMEAGHLVARPGVESSSQGRALYAAHKGEDIAIVELEGIIDMRLGEIMILRLPGAREGGTRALDLKETEKVVKAHKGDLLAVVDSTATALASKLSISPDIAFGAVWASVEAAMKGMDVLLLVSEELASEAITTIEGAREGLAEGISYRVLDLPRSTKGTTDRRSKSRNTRR